MPTFTTLYAPTLVGTTRFNQTETAFDLTATAGGGAAMTYRLSERVYVPVGTDGYFTYPNVGLISRQIDLATGALGEEVFRFDHPRTSTLYATTGLATGAQVVWAPGGGLEASAALTLIDAAGGATSLALPASASLISVAQVEPVAGGFLAVWREYGAMMDLHAQRFNREGLAVGPQIVAATPDHDDGKVAIQADGSLGVVMLSDLGDGLPGDLSFRVIGADGATRSSLLLAQDQGLGTWDIIALKGGGFAVTWVEISGGLFGPPDSKIWVQTFDAQGLARGDRVLVQEAHAEGAIYGAGSPLMEALPDGSFLLKWDRFTMEGAQTALRSFDASGMPITEEQLLAPGAGTTALDMVGLADGRTALSWATYGGDMMFQVIDARLAAVDVTGNGLANDLRGTGWDDTLGGGAGDDLLTGAEGHDRLDGGAGRDSLWGSAGDDRLLGGGQRDVLRGEEGRDLLEGGRGNDVLRGGTGQDVFVFAAGSGRDKVVDFAHGDVLDLRGWHLGDIASHVTAWGEGLAITQGADRIVVLGLTPAELQSGDYLL